MAALHFIYSTMNAGKSTALLQASHGYRERGLETMVFTSSKDDRYGESEVVSRVGLRSPAHTYSESDNILKMVHDENEKHELSCILIDEAQFLTKDQVKQLGKIVDELKITVMAFGIRKFCAIDLCTKPNSNNIHIFCSNNAGRYEKINSIFFCCSYGLCYTGNFYYNSTRFRR